MSVTKTLRGSSSKIINLLNNSKKKAAYGSRRSQVYKGWNFRGYNLLIDLAERKKKQIAILIIAIFIPVSANASLTCKGHFVNPKIGRAHV